MIGNEIHKFAQKLWALNRSITGEEVRETLSEIKNLFQLLKYILYLQIRLSLTGLSQKSGRLRMLTLSLQKVKRFVVSPKPICTFSVIAFHSLEL